MAAQYLKGLFQEVNQVTSLNITQDLGLFDGRIEHLVDRGRLSSIECMSKYEDKLNKLRKKQSLETLDKFTKLLYSLTTPYLKCALRHKGKKVSGLKHELIHRVKGSDKDLFEFGHTIQSLDIIDSNVEEKLKSL